MIRLLLLVSVALLGPTAADIATVHGFHSSVVHASGGPVVPVIHPEGLQADPSGHGGQCALIIPAAGRSARFDHTLSVIRGQPAAAPYSGSETCITFDAVNAAFEAAASRHRLSRSDHRMEVEELGQLGMVLTDVTETLAKSYSLPHDAVVNGLPLIDTMKTNIAHFCPRFLSGGMKCEATRYRTVDGMCNNLENPHWGAARNTFRRLLAPSYRDGVKVPRVLSKEGHGLPSARVVSVSLHRDHGFHDHAVTMMLVAWGQLIDHDITFTGEMKPKEKDSKGRPKMPDCCNDPRQAGNTLCFPIEIPEEDGFYNLYGQKCMNVIRSLPGVHRECRLGARGPINTVSSYLDASFLYGSDHETARRMRTYRGGLMKTLPVFRESGLKDLLPPNLHDPDEGCIRPNKDIFCFDAGDGRVNEQLVLAILQTIFMREHNRVVSQLAQLNPHWDDETLFQETRLIVGALVQHITFNEFLPMVLGKSVMDKENIVLGKGHKYNPHMDASTANEFASAAFRFGHSLLPSTIERWSTTGKYIDARRLSELLRQPYDMYKGGYIDQYIMGLMNQLAHAMDDAVTQEVTNHLFQMPEHRFGMDLASINMQRGREHGLHGYNDYREYCGLPRMSGFGDLRHWMTNNTASVYGNVYSHVDDLDLWSGAISEKPLPGSMVGPTLACLISEQFRALKYGDRFWYENQGFPSSFTPEQIAQIKKMKLSTLMCDNTDHIERTQVYLMVLPDHRINPHATCASLPRMDLSAWKDVSGPHPFGK